MKQYKKGEIGYDRIYDAYNRLVLAHVPAEESIRYIIDFASESKGKLQNDMMGPIADAPGLKGVLSTGSRDLINHLINHPVSRYWTIEANSVIPSGKNAKGSALFLRVYENKPRWIQETFYDTQAFDPRNTVYLGDNADEEPAFEYVTASGGRIVMPFLASEDFKQHCAEKYKAEVPKDEKELRLLLK